MGVTRQSATAREIKVRLRKLTARAPQRLRLWFAGLHEPSGYRIQTSVHQPTLLALLLGRHDDIRYLKRWRLTRQRKHLVHGDPGSDRCIAQAGFVTRCLHPLRSEFSHVSKHCSKSLFSFGYALSFALSDGADSLYSSVNSKRSIMPFAARAFALVKSGFSTRVATTSGRSISAKRTENCRVAELL